MCDLETGIASPTPSKVATTVVCNAAPSKSSTHGRSKTAAVVPMIDPKISPSPSPSPPPKVTLKTKPKRARKKKSLDDGTNRKVTEFFPVRRSSRKPAVMQKMEEEERIAVAIKTIEETGIAIVQTPGKGRGVHTTQAYAKGEYIVEYRGDLIFYAEALRREEEYSKDSSKGCYMYFFEHATKTYCVDATAESIYKGRLINHSARRPNVKTRVFADAANVPHLILVAKRSMEAGTELLYDYGERNKEVIANNPWLTAT